MRSSEDDPGAWASLGGTPPAAPPAVPGDRVAGVLGEPVTMVPSAPIDARPIPATLPGLAASRRAAAFGAPVGLFDRQDRRPVAIVVTSDGRRVNVPLDELRTEPAPGLLQGVVLFLLGLVGLITGSRQEAGRTRRTR
jgi:hypothetical protein